MTHVNTGHGALIRNKHTIIWPKNDHIYSENDVFYPSNNFSGQIGQEIPIHSYSPPHKLRNLRKPSLDTITLAVLSQG